MASECPQCGARFESDETCEGWFQATQLLEFEQPAYYAVHHLSVPAYMLQHNRYSREGWLFTRQLLAQFVGGALTPGEALQRTRGLLARGRRAWSFTRGPRLAEVEQIVWTRTGRGRARRQRRALLRRRARLGGRRAGRHRGADPDAQPRSVTKGRTMDGVFLLLARHFWAVLLIVTALNAVALRRRFRSFIARHPGRERGYRQMLAWFVGVNVLLWGTMGAGILFGDVPHVFAYLAPASGNLFVLVWHALYIGLALLGLVWLLFRGGAEFLVDHPGMLKVGGLSPGLVKLWFGLVLLGGLLVELTLWSLGAGPPAL